MYCSTFTETNQIKTISREILVDLARILTGLLTFSNPQVNKEISTLVLLYYLPDDLVSNTLEDIQFFYIF